jgi:hypothetical protein
MIMVLVETVEHRPMVKKLRFTHYIVSILKVSDSPNASLICSRFCAGFEAL